MVLQKKTIIDGICFQEFPFLKKYRIFCGFTSRHSGYSKEPYYSLNLAYHVGEPGEVVKKNRDMVLDKILGIKEGAIYSARQVHGKKIIYVGDDTPAMDGDMAVEADGLVTDRANRPLAVLGADCSLILMADTARRTVCAVHAGWKGTLQGIVLEAVKTMQRGFRSALEDIKVFIGPCIRLCCYEVDEGLAGDFIKKFGRQDHIHAAGGRSYLDLPGLNRYQLRKTGIPDDNILDTGNCTACSEEYYSYRRDRTTGRQAAIAMILP